MGKWLQDNLGIILNIAVLIFALIMAYIPIRYDIVERDVHGRPIYLTGKGWLFIIFLILAVVFGVWKIINDDKDTRDNKTAVTNLNKKVDDLDVKMGKRDQAYDNLVVFSNSLQNKLIDLEKEGDSNTNKILASKAKASQVVYQAKLGVGSPIGQMQTNPAIGKRNDSTFVQFHISNFGNDYARNIRDLCYLCGRVGSRRLFIGLQTPQVNSESQIPNNQEGVLFVYPTAVKINGPYFVCLKITYTNSKGLFKDSIQNIFYVNGLDVRDAWMREDDSIRAILKEKNIW